MIVEELQLISQLLRANNHPQIAQCFRHELLSKLPCRTPQSLLSSLSMGSEAEPPIPLPKKRSEMVNAGVIKRMICSGRLLQDSVLNGKATRLLGSSLYERTVARLARAKVGQREESGETGQVGTMEEYVSGEEDEYRDDFDLGYHEYVFQQHELRDGCAELSRLLNYPFSVVGGDREPPLPLDRSKTFAADVQFPMSVGMDHYPLTRKGVVYDCMSIAVIYDRERTGYEVDKEIKFRRGDLLAGRYVVDQIMGSGVFASVIRANDVVSGRVTCFKMVSNNKDFFDQAIDEIKLLRYIKSNCDPISKHILQFKSVFYHREHLFIETQLLKDNLFSAYRKMPSLFTVDNIRVMARQMLTAVSQLHRLKVVHSDLKPENILIREYAPLSVVVIDLGNSCFSHDHMGSYVQSRSYRAPQVILGLEYDYKIDVWSIGCILAELWTKNVLFYNMHVAGMLAKIQGVVGPWPAWMLETGSHVSTYFSKENILFVEDKGEYHILVPKKTSLNCRIRCNHSQFVHLIRCLLEIDPRKRMSAEEALKHPFFKE